ncbi:MAG TPA: hypothetical protein H9671_00535 [Firmicutes bacterium]|nr:hypothetical protein [Bacillota bacterium]
MNSQKEFDEIMRQALRAEEEPPEALRLQLQKQLEAEIPPRQRKNIFLWYVPFILNSLFFSTLGLWFLYFSTGWLRWAAVGICGHLILCCGVLTVIGLRFGDLKKQLCVTIK